MSGDNLQQYVDRILFTEEEIQRRVAELGAKITADYANKNADLLVVGILKGASVFMADLLKHIDLDVEIDFMSVSSYGAGTVSSGDVRIIKDLEQPIMGKNVLIVEDIVDTGYTLKYLMENLLARGAHSVKIACMLDKEERRVTEITGDYVGFAIPDEYVIGYGMDFNQKLRNLPFIGTLNPIYYRHE
ncbi:hypoxanthine phosphoribosyltransferase [Murdochiella sp. Marseille-P8839]|nr:hypoxanthine phosphoribosyltransferase [Murdochiella sp. Marseille-P8839]